MRKRKAHVSCGARSAVLVFGFYWPLRGPAQVSTDSAAVAAGNYSEKAGRSSAPGNSGHSLVCLGSDCTLAFGWGHWAGMTCYCCCCKNFAKQAGRTGNWGEGG